MKWLSIRFRFEIETVNLEYFFYSINDLSFPFHRRKFIIGPKHCPSSPENKSLKCNTTHRINIKYSFDIFKDSSPYKGDKISLYE